MKKLWIVLLSVALIMAFAMPVCAADVKFSGNYIIQGYYDNDRALMKDGGPSVTNTWQRLRVKTDFKIQEGLTLVTMFDALEKVWGAPRTTGQYTTTYNTSGVQGTGSGEAENIKWQDAYVVANLWGGQLAVGYQTTGAFGTAFGDYSEYSNNARIKYTYVVGPWTFLGVYDKVEGTQYYAPGGPAGNIGNSLYQVDQDTAAYRAAFIYNWGKGNAGFLFNYIQDSAYGPLGAAGHNPNPATDTGWKRIWYVPDAYMKAQFGPLYVEAEVIYKAGKTRKYDTSSNGTDMTADGWSAYASGTYDFAPMYAGVNLIYVAGIDYNAPDKDNSGWPGMLDFNPMLLLFNYDLARWNGNLGPNGGVVQNSGITNAQIAQVFVGMKPMPKLDVRVSYAVANADKDGSAPVGTSWQSRDYGKELDVTATYKIYDNLSYMVGFAYLWAGDFFKGTSSTQVDNDYLVTHKLTLTF